MNLINKFTSSLVAVTLTLSMMTGTLPVKHDDSSTSVVITASAAKVTYKPGARSGKRTAYISKLGITSTSLTICGNTDEDVEDMVEWLDKMSTACSGGKPGAAVIKASKGIFGSFGGGSTLLTVFQKIFSSMGGFGSSAAKAKKELINLTNKYPLQGFKVTISQKSWVVETQAKDKDLEKAYKEYIEKTTKKYFAVYKGSSKSIVDALKALKVQNPSFSYRKKVYEANKLQAKYGKYSGSSKQNTAMLNLLTKGKLLKP
ncbi:hypothetical protein RASY3_13980 [Ruminococcus albus SY3]|uniref:Uncharacterized protein n=1 Tax=Ruminococcus albus SY3 TaxID=1341156 RepID=A0A011WN89_RUMAL|nr:hypothetical protein [Ruminococcus albus]EXM38465.1 hypothetical protein RASY3_13980 [Ruminococcus albus SY3]